MSILSFLQYSINCNSYRVEFICRQIYYYLIFGKYLINVADSSPPFLVITDYIYFTLRCLAIFHPSQMIKYQMNDDRKYLCYPNFTKTLCALNKQSYKYFSMFDYLNNNLQYYPGTSGLITIHICN